MADKINPSLIDLPKWILPEVHDEIVQFPVFLNGLVNTEKYELLLVDPLFEKDNDNPDLGWSYNIYVSDATKTTKPVLKHWAWHSKIAPPSEAKEVEASPNAESSKEVIELCKFAPLEIDSPPITSGATNALIEAFQNHVIENPADLGLQAFHSMKPPKEGTEPTEYTKGKLDLLTKSWLATFRMQNAQEIFNIHVEAYGISDLSQFEQKEHWDKTSKLGIGYATWKVMSKWMGVDCINGTVEPAPEAEAEKPSPPVDPNAPDAFGPATHYIRERIYGKGKNKGKKRPHRITTASGLVIGKILGGAKALIQVLVEEEAVGPGSGWSRIKVVAATGVYTTEWLEDQRFKNESFYIKSKYLAPVKGTPRSLPIKEPLSLPQRQGNHRAHPWPMHWTELDPYGYRCYYDAKTNEYKIKLLAPAFRKPPAPKKAADNKTPFETLADFEKNADKKAILRAGVRSLLYYYDKDVSVEKRVINAFKGAYIPKGTDGLHKDPRRGVIDVLVCFPAKYFDALADNQYSEGELQEEMENAEFSVNFAWSTLPDRVEYTVKKINKYANIINKKFPNVGATMLAAAKELQIFPSRLKAFLLLNGIGDAVLEKQEIVFEIGFSEQFKMQYVFLQRGNDEVAIPLMIGRDAFVGLVNLVLLPHAATPTKTEETFKKESKILQSQQAAMHYLWTMHKLIKETQDPKFPATKFANLFHFPVPGFQPSAADEKPEDVPPSPAQPGGKEPASASQEELDKNLKADPGKGKSSADLQRENAKLNDADRKIKIFQHRGYALDFTGDNLVEDLTFLAKNINSAEDAYTHILNKTNLEQLAEIALSAMLCSMSNDMKQRLLLAKLIKDAAADCIKEIRVSVQEMYPDQYKKAHDEVVAEKEQEQEQTGKKPLLVPKVLQGKDGTESTFKRGKAADSLGRISQVTDKTPQDPPLEGSGAEITSQLTTAEKDAVRPLEGENPAHKPAFNATADPQKTPTEKLSEADHKRVLLKFANDTKGNYQLSRPVFQRLVMACVPNHDVQHAMNLFFKHADEIADMIPPMPPPTVGPFKDNITTDPTPNISDMIAKAIQAALAAALLAAIILIISQIKKSIDEACEEDFGEFKGELDSDDVEEAFKVAGVDLPSGIGPEFMDCLVELVTASEIKDMLAGRISDEVLAAILFCAGKKPEIVPFIPQLPLAFMNLNLALPPEMFLKYEEKAQARPIPPPGGLLCEDDEFDEGSDGEPIPLQEDPLEQAQKDRQLAMANRLADIIDNVDSLLDSVETAVMADCADDSIIHPAKILSFGAANDKVLSAIFAGAKMAFSNDAAGFADSMIIKRLSPAHPGDPDFWGLTSGGEEVINPQTGEVEDPPGAAKKWAKIKNEDASKVRTAVAPFIRKNFIDPKSFIWKELPDASHPAGGNIVLRAYGSFSKPIDTESYGLGDPYLKKLRDNLHSLQYKLENLKTLADDMDEGKQGLILTAAIEAQTAKVETAENLLCEVQEAWAKKKPPATDSIQHTIEKILSYKVPYAKGKKLKDRFGLSLRTQTGWLDEIFISQDPIAKYPKDDYNINFTQKEGVFQAEMFAHHILRQYTKNGIKVLTPGPQQAHYKQLKLAYGKIFQNLFSLAARQVGRSKIFDLESFQALSFVSPRDPNDVDSPPGENAPYDLLGFVAIKEEIKKEYADNPSCKPTPVDEAGPHAFKDATRQGVVKMFIRLHMLEPLMRSVFVFSEFSVAEIFHDNLFPEFILQSMEKGLARLDMSLYDDVRDAARIMLDEKIQAGKEIENINNILNMGFIKRTDGTETEQSTEAIKYFAMEQFDDLVEKFEDVVGARTTNIFQRFLRHPQNHGGGVWWSALGHSTPPGHPVQTPTDSPHGWIRTIDVAKAQTTSLQDTRFVRRSPEMKTGEYQKGGATTSTKVILQYPDLSEPGGTFFLERYIRVEDITNSGPDTLAGIHIQSRVGGPSFTGDLSTPSTNDKVLSPGPTNAAPIYKPHLSGVVNINAWADFVHSFREEFGNAHTPNAIKKYFKPWKYGLRLVYVPPMNPNAGLTPTAAYWSSKSTEKQTGTSTTHQGNLEDWNSIKLEAGKLKKEDNAGYTEMLKKFELNKDKPSDAAYGIEAAFNANLTGNGANHSKKVAAKEKAFYLEETIDLLQQFQSSEKTAVQVVVGGTPHPGTKTVTKSANLYTKHTRRVYTIPIASVEKEIDDLTFMEELLTGNGTIRKKYRLDAYGMISDLIETEEFQFLFKYIFPLPRMLSLLTIYNANVVELAIPETIESFDQTKEVLRNLFYTLDSGKAGDNKEKWWQRQSLATKELGGNAGLKETQQAMASPKGVGTPSLGSMAARTIPLFVRGMAQYVDPHYKLVSALTEAGYLPTGKTWASVPILWPVNFPFGWGPPLTSWGMMAYSMPEPAGDVAAKKASKAIKDGTEDKDGTGAKNCE